MSVLVTGGNGYIGSQTVWDLTNAGEEVIVVDNLSTGSRNAIPDGIPFYQGDFGDPAFVGNILKSYKVDAILHLAGTIAMRDGIDFSRYFENNVTKTLRLLECAAAHGVRRFTLSSSSAVYDVTSSSVAENSPTNPESSYGRSKRIAEWLLMDFSQFHPMNYAILRYFNVAGADPEGRCGPLSPLTSDIVRTAAEVATGKRATFEIFGDDYETDDGTCVRDFIHVKDVASMHRLALQRLRVDNQNLLLNCGSGRGHSVRGVVRACETIIGRALPTAVSNRRPGDIPTLISNSDAARSLLKWKPEFSDLDTIMKTALRWEINKTRQPHISPSA